MNNQPIEQILKQNIIRLRKANKYTQKDVAALLNVSHSHYSKIENKKKDALPSLQLIQEIAQLYNVEYYELFTSQ